MPWWEQEAVLQHNQPLQSNSSEGCHRIQHHRQQLQHQGQLQHHGQIQHQGQLQRWPALPAAGQRPSSFQFLGQPSLTQLLYPALYPLLHQPRNPGRHRLPGAYTFRQTSSWHSPCLPSHPECCKREPQECGALPGLVAGHSQLRLPSPSSLPFCAGQQAKGLPALPPFPLPSRHDTAPSCQYQTCQNLVGQCHGLGGGEQVLYPKLQQPPPLVQRNFSLDNASCLGKQPPRICNQQKVKHPPIICLYCWLLCTLFLVRMKLKGHQH